MNTTHDINQFLGMIATQKNRKNIITEGDSWFGYPSNTFLMGQGSNIVDHVAATNKYNVLRLESNGDEASSIMTSQQRHQLIEILSLLSQKQYPIHHILFSGGGNDIVGKDDMPFFLNTYINGMNANDCIKWSRLNIRMSQIEIAYAELIAIRDELCKDTKILTHGYDYLIPNGIPASFLGGAIKSGPWIKPFLDQKGIPVALHNEIVKLIIDRLNEVLDGLQKHNSNFHKVELRGLLNSADWINEIHPTSAGFKTVAGKFISAL